MKPEIYSASDYAGLATNNVKFYYGYEVVDENNEWCFTAKFGEVDIKIPFSKLKVHDQFDCVRCLLAGIGLVLTQYKLTL